MVKKVDFEFQEIMKYKRLLKPGRTKKVGLDVIIMAGGLGTRLKPFTNVLPKALLPIKNKTLIEKVIEKFTNYGSQNFIISINYKGKKIKSFFKKLKPKYKYNFIEEKEALGNAGSLSLLKDKKEQDYFITNADTIIDFDCIRSYNFHKKSGNDFTLIVSRKKFVIPWGVCKLNSNGSLRNIIEKPHQYSLANTGVYITSNRLFSLIKKNTFTNLIDFISILKKAKKKIGIYSIGDKNWIDVGEWISYEKILKNFK